MLVTCYRRWRADDVRRRAKLPVERPRKPLPTTRATASPWALALDPLGGHGRRRARAKEWVTRAVLIDPDNISMRYNLACGLAHLGDADAVVGLLEPYFARVSLTMLRHCSVDPDMDPMRDDPRFQAMMEEALVRLGAVRADLPGDGRLPSSGSAAGILA